MAHPLNLTNRRFGRLIALRFHDRVGVKRRWLCQCDCGQSSLAHVHDLMSGKHISCGCYQREQASSASLEHGKSRTREYETWCRMIERCENPKMSRYADYGGRGIKISPEWRASFQQFYADMGPRPGDGYSIDRIDNNGHYEAGNCRWATAFQQVHNRRKYTRRKPKAA